MNSTQPVVIKKLFLMSCIDQGAHFLITAIRIPSVSNLQRGPSSLFPHNNNYADERQIDCEHIVGLVYARNRLCKAPSRLPLILNWRALMENLWALISYHVSGQLTMQPQEH